MNFTYNFNKIKTILITGGAGFAGSNLAVFLKNDYPQLDIISFDNLHRRGAEINLRRLKKNNVRFVHGDIRIKEDIEYAGDFDLLIECSAEPSVLSGYHESPAYLYQTNLVGTLNCLEVCRVRKAGIVFLSTSRVYPMESIRNATYTEQETRLILAPDQLTAGISEYGISESFPLEGVRSLYGASKLCSELMIQEYIAAYNLKGIINRCGVITGPWQMGKVDQGFVVLWIARHLWGGSLSYIGYGGKGRQVRDILYIADLYELLCHQISKMDELSGTVFNVGGGMDLSISLYELTLLCQKITGNAISISSVPANRDADIPFYVSDCRKIYSQTGWKPKTDLETIVKNIYQWLCENESDLKPILCGE